MLSTLFDKLLNIKAPELLSESPKIYVFTHDLSKYYKQSFKTWRPKSDLAHPLILGHIASIRISDRPTTTTDKQTKQARQYIKTCKWQELANFQQWHLHHDMLNYAVLIHQPPKQPHAQFTIIEMQDPIEFTITPNINFINPISHNDFDQIISLVTSWQLISPNAESLLKSLQILH
ncbi:hypothetical protein JD969_04840 [Planctomycetota bacterium]|nr:hypothetical protein JD969_04840 [Planctomycetota bacterium]